MPTGRSRWHTLECAHSLWCMRRHVHGPDVRDGTTRPRLHSRLRLRLCIVERLRLPRGHLALRRSRGDLGRDRIEALPVEANDARTLDGDLTVSSATYELVEGDMHRHGELHHAHPHAGPHEHHSHHRHEHPRELVQGTRTLTPPLARENTQRPLGSGVQDHVAGERHGRAVLWCECDLHRQRQAPVAAQRGLALRAQGHREGHAARLQR
jgi:hypothetical protein